MPELSGDFSRSRAYLVGIEAYSASRLFTPVNDVKLIAGALIHHEFKEEDIVVATNLTKTDFEELVKRMKKEINENERVLFYFAGHGIAQEHDRPRGFLLPVNAVFDKEETFINLHWLMREFNDLKCRHFLLVLDCCFAGTVRWAESLRTIRFDNVKKLYRERFERFIKDTAWQVITSSAYDETALDCLLPLGQRDDKHIFYSPFATILADLLLTSESIFPDGVITTIRLYNELELRFSRFLRMNKPSFKQTPSYFPLEKHRNGQFIFLKPGKWKDVINNLPGRGQVNPYKGLQSYANGDSHLFFGRDKAISELSVLIREQNTGIILVAGASGTGKSSLLHAGIIPIIKQNFSKILTYRPGNIRKDELITDKIRSEIDQETAVVIIIDQFEELLTECTIAEKDKWLHLLAYLKARVDAVLIILSVRIDFEYQMRQIFTSISLHIVRYVLAPMQRHEVESVILQPARQNAIEIKTPDSSKEALDAFINEIVDAAMQSIGSLPLLSYLMEEWYIRSVKIDPWSMPQNIYTELGGVSGALAQIMEGFLSKLNATDIELVKNILVRMVAITDIAFARRKRYSDEFDYEDPEKLARAKILIKELCDYRIIVSNTIKTNDAPEIISYEPAHDAVINSWATLSKWLNQEREKIKVYDRIADDAKRWKNTKKSKADILWRKGTDLSLVLNDVNSKAETEAPLKARQIPNTFSWQRFLGTTDAGNGYLNKNENAFLHASIKRIRRRQTSLLSIISILLLTGVVTATVFYKNKRTNEALFINSTSEGSSPSEKLLLLQKAFDLDAEQQVTKDNIVRLLNLSPSYYCPFASNIIYHRGNNARNIIKNEENGEYITVADSSLVWWTPDMKKKRVFKENTEIAYAGFLHGSGNMYYMTFTGQLKIFGENEKPVNANLLTQKGAYYRDFHKRSITSIFYSDSLNKFLLISYGSSDQIGSNLVISAFSASGDVLTHDTLPVSKINSFIGFLNDPAGELYLYDTQWLLTFNFRTKDFHQYELWKEPKEVGAIDLTKGPVANDFPVFKYSRDGKSFFYKPFKDSCFSLSITPAGAKIKKRGAFIRDAVFAGPGNSLLAVTGKGVELVADDNTMEANSYFASNLVSVNASANGKYYLVDDADGNIYMLSQQLAPLLLIDKSYNIEKSAVTSDCRTLLLTSRTGAFYLFDLSVQNYLMKAKGRSLFVPLPLIAACATFGQDDTGIEIIHAAGTSYFFDTDTSIVNIWTSATNDSIFVVTLKSYYIITPEGKELSKKPFYLFSQQEELLPLDRNSFIVRYDSTLRIFSYDMKQTDSLKLRDKIENVFIHHAGDFILLTRKGEVALYDKHLNKKWHFSDDRLAVKYIGEQINYRPPLVYKRNDAGEYICFDTTGWYQGKGQLARNTSIPGGNYNVNPQLDTYLFSPPNLYNNVQTITYDNILYDGQGQQLFNYRFNKVVAGTILNEEKILFQSTGDYELFTQFTPAGAIKKFKELKIQLADADR